MRIFCTLVLLFPLLAFAQDHPGKADYDKYCTQCHGDAGDGKGYAHDVVLPRPRDFTTGTFRFRTTSNESLPNKADLERVIKNGIYGTSMPSFELIGDKGISDVADYVTSFYQSWIDQGVEDGTYPAETIKIGNPPAVTDAMIAEGKQEYINNQCADCHGHDGKADGPSAPTLVDDYDTPIRAANLFAPWRFRSGPALTDIFKAFSTGISGTPMPSYRAALDDSKRWALAAYVDSLAVDSEPNPSAEVIGKSITGDLPDTADHELWDQAVEAYFPLSAQIIWDPVNIDPTVHNVRVRVLHNGEELAMRLQWDDSSFSLEGQAAPGGGDEDEEEDWGAEEEEEDEGWGDDDDDDSAASVVLSDSFAVQFPTGVPKGNERPYFVMGDAKYGVNMWRWTNSDSVTEQDQSLDPNDPWSRYNKKYAGEAGLSSQLGKGRESVSEISGGEALSGAITYHNGTYSLLIHRKLISAESKETQLVPGTFTPIAFWAWDGHNGEADAKGSLSAWSFLILERPTDSSVYVKAVGAMVLMLLFLLFCVHSARKKSEGDVPSGEPATAEA